MTISVIIPTAGRADLLQRTLSCLAAAMDASVNAEILILHTGHDEATRTLAQRLAPTSKIPLRYHQTTRPGLHVGRHAGALLASGDILAYLDDDVQVERGWLPALAESFADPRVLLVGGNCLPEYEVPPPAWLDALWEHTSDGRLMGALSLIEFSGGPRAIPPHHVFGCNFAIRRSALEAAGGFHPDGMPQSLLRFRGDGETHVSQFVQTSGGIAWFHPGASLRHWVPRSRMTLDYLWRRGYAQGISDSFTAIRSAGHAPSAPPASAPITLRWPRCKHLLKAALQRKWAAERARMELRDGHRAGYAFHQAEVARDPDLLAWVLRPDYWDEQCSPSWPEQRA